MLIENCALAVRRNRAVPTSSTRRQGAKPSNLAVVEIRQVDQAQLQRRLPFEVGRRLPEINEFPANLLSPTAGLVGKEREVWPGLSDGRRAGRIGHTITLFCQWGGVTDTRRTQRRVSLLMPSSLSALKQVQVELRKEPENEIMRLKNGFPRS